MASADNGLCATIYSACEVKARVGNGEDVTITEETHYPFEETIHFTIALKESLSFPISWRVPAWCKSARLSINGKAVSVHPVAGQFIRVERLWSNRDKVLLELPMAVSVQKWADNHNSISIDYGPLTFSLKIGERYIRQDSSKTAQGDASWQKGADPSRWPSYEIHPTTAWNYGLVWDGGDPAKTFKVSRGSWPKSDFPFTLAEVPLKISAKARKISAWTLDRYGLCAPLQDSPALTKEPIETVDLVPMGAARLRISAFPTVTSDSQIGHVWQPPALPKLSKYKASASHCYEADSVEAIGDGLLPENSNDHNIPRLTWWPHLGSREWAQFDFNSVKKISSAAVYWFDDSGVGKCRIPASARLLYKSGGEWKFVPGGEIGVKADTMNRVTFTPISTTAVRLDTQLQPEFSAGILEWQVAE